MPQAIHNLCVVLPMKCPSRAKQRLSGSLSNPDRQRFALRMFESTLAFFQRHFPALDVLVVSESLEVLKLAQTYQANTLFEEGHGGLNGALTFACDWVMQSGYDAQLIVPSDIAKLDTTEIQTLIDAAKEAQVIIASAKDGGTNALLSAPANAISFCYGHQSARIHQAKAESQGLLWRRFSFPHLALDIDQQADLSEAAQQQPERYQYWSLRTQRIAKGGLAYV